MEDLQNLSAPRLNIRLGGPGLPIHSYVDIFNVGSATAPAYVQLEQGWATFMIKRATKMLSSLPEGQILIVNFQDSLTPSFHWPIIATKINENNKINSSNQNVYYQHLYF